jgi:hypothetical protein
MPFLWVLLLLWTTTRGNPYAESFLIALFSYLSFCVPGTWHCLSFFRRYPMILTEMIFAGIDYLCTAHTFPNIFHTITLKMGFSFYGMDEER